MSSSKLDGGNPVPDQLSATYDPQARALYVTTGEHVEGRRRHTEEHPFGIEGMNWDWEEDPAGEGNDRLLGIEVLLDKAILVLPQGDTGNAYSLPPITLTFQGHDASD